uniref:Uncharacterized protein n=1 Tax=Hordeum vulgare subsp. vulgare TaxID=112509 RepID=A0A8I6XBV9_HORVV
MPPTSLLLLLLLLAGGAAAEPPAPAPPAARNETIYDILPLFGLPAGVFPANVHRLLARRQRQPRRRPRRALLRALRGVQVRRFLVWFTVVRVKVDLPPPPRFVYLDIGWITRKLPAADFQSLHPCEDSKRRGCRLSSALAAAAAWFQDFFAQF